MRRTTPDLTVTRPSDDTALIVAVRLPAALEAIRHETVREARAGLPAHATLLYPFAPPAALDDASRRRVARIVAGHAAFWFRLTGPGRWPDTVYASVEPEMPFRALHEDLAAAFPEFPLYRGAYPFVPHVTIAEGPSADDPRVVAADDRQALPARRIARFVDLIVRDGDRWVVRWRLPLRAPPSPQR
ncbi:MAG: 2'-5' RNA ligase family protein [Candidatus Limnocylindrales bacterium]